MVSLVGVLLGWRSMAPTVTALLAAAVVASPVAPAITADLRTQGVGEASGQEISGVYARGFTASWVSRGPGDGEVCFRPIERPEAGERCVEGPARTRYHVVDVGGLAPATAYAYRLLSDGEQAPTGPASPGTLTTLPLPPGRHLGDVVVMNDIHIGETCSGHAADLFGRSLPACTQLPDGVAPGTYSERMVVAATRQIRALAPAAVFVNGDLTNSGSFPDMVRAKQLLDRLGIPYGVTRGNHDRPRQGGPGEAGRCGAARDCFSTVFRPGDAWAVQPRAYAAAGARFLLLDDSAHAQGGTFGELADPGQRRWLARELAAWPRTPTFVLVHHPASYYSTATMSGRGTPRTLGGAWLHDVVAANPQVVGVLAGHSHRNLLAYDASSGEVPWIENGAAKAYPAGFMVLRLYQGGYIREFHRIECPGGDDFCGRWSAATAQESWGSARRQMLGALSARAFTHVYGCAHRTPRHSTLPWDLGGATDQDTGARARGSVLSHC